METAPRRLIATSPLGVFLLILEGVVDARRVEHGRVEDRVRAHQPLVGQPIRVVSGFDEQRLQRLRALDAPHRAARNDDVVAGLDRQVTVVAEQVAAPGVNEQQFVAIGIARELRHVAGEVPEAQSHRGVVQQLRGVPGRVLAAWRVSCNRRRAAAAGLRSSPSRWADGGDRDAPPGRRSLPC